MSVPYLTINSVSYTSSVVTVNTNYSYLRGGGSFSITGFSNSLYYSVTSSYAVNNVATFSVGLSASSTFNLVFTFYKGPMINYPLDQPSIMGVTGATTYALGGVPYVIGFSNPPTTIIYETSRIVGEYTLLT